MDKSEVSRQLQTLETFSEWQDTYREVKRSESASPSRFDPDNREHLQKQVRLLDAREAQVEARSGLVRELAQQDDRFLPLTYRLGILVGLQIATVSLEPIIRPNSFGSSTSFTITRRGPKRRSLLDIDMSEIPVRRADNPIERGVQIARAAEEVQKALNTAKPIPVCMVWNHKFRGNRLDRDDVVLGTVKKPEQAFILSEPTFDEDGSPVFEIPTSLRGVTKGEVIWRPEYVEPESRYKNPRITKLGKLIGSYKREGPDALYIGKKDVDKRVDKARRDMLAYSDTLRSRSQYRRRFRRTLLR